MKIIKVPIASVLPWDKNPRGIKTKDYERLKKQIKKLGVYKPLLAYEDKGKYVVLGGNMRIRALKEMGIPEVDISVVNPKNEAEKVEFALSDNDRAGFYEEDKLAELIYPHIKDIELGAFKVDLGEALDLKQVVERYGPDIEDGADDVPEVDDSPAITKMGDLFTLGKHRLLCGDSTKAEDVARLMRGEKADMVFTDPPYGVGYDGGAKKRDALTGDNIGTTIYGDALPHLRLSVSDHAALYLWYADAHAAAAAAAAAGYEITAQIIWVKNHAQFVTSAHYKGKHEPCFYGHRKGKVAQWFGPNNEVTVWECDRAQKNEYHPTQKPVPLAERAMCNSSKAGDSVLDLFLGSGTTLIAAEKTGRVCYGMEIDPKYCDVIIKRYADYVGVSEDGIRKTRENPNG